MRSVLTVLGIAVVALVISIMIQDSKKLSPAPQEDAARATEKEQMAALKKAEENARAKEKTAKGTFNPPREDRRRAAKNE